jgi:hypothetical protein
MSLSIFLVLFALPLIGFSLMLSFGFAGQKHKKEPYSLLSYFPYELFGDSRGPFFPYARFGEGILLLGECALPAYLISAYASYGEPTLSFVIALSVFSLCGALSALFLSIISLADAKGHLLLAITSALLSVLVTSMEGYLLFASAPAQANGTLCYVLAGILWALALLILLPYFNPKLSDWAKMDKEVGEDGSVSLKRPRPFVLAFSEWLSITSYLIACLVACLAFFLI